MTDDDASTLLRRMFDAAIAAADPAKVLAGHLCEKPKGRCVVVGGGKSAASMARAVEAAWPDVDLSGVVVTRYGHAVPTDRIKVLEASQPVPDDAALSATREVMEAAASAGPEDLVLALISGGGSALLSLPRPPLTLEDLVAVNKALLSSGLSISEMNKVRRRLSQVKGGGLARMAAPARLVTLAISDVPGDDPEAIASGPTVPDPTANVDLSYLVNKLGPALPDAAARMLRAPSPDAEDFTPDFRLIATPQASLEAAADIARDAGVTPVLLGDALEGEARELGTASSSRWHWAASPSRSGRGSMTGARGAADVGACAGRAPRPAMGAAAGWSWPRRAHHRPFSSQPPPQRRTRGPHRRAARRAGAQ